MKTKEYIKEFKGFKKFKTTDFIDAFKEDFKSLIETDKADENIFSFFECIKKMEQKFESINNKTGGLLKDNLWDYCKNIFILEGFNLYGKDVVERHLANQKKFSLTH